MALSSETCVQFEKLGLTPEEVAEIAVNRPSLRGMLMGYAAEYKVRKEWFIRPEITDLFVPDDHDRTQKFDIGFKYKGEPIRVEVKSLQTNSVKLRDPTARSGWRSLKSLHMNPSTPREGEQQAIFQCDASDRRMVTFPSGTKIETTCILIDAFDLLAIGLFAFGHGWNFAFARNRDLPRSAHKKYPPETHEFLLASSMPITWPLKPPYEAEPYRLLDEIVQVRASQKR
jgi:hypothetical protein